jgi:hypothetical protein
MSSCVLHALVHQRVTHSAGQTPPSEVQGAPDGLRSPLSHYR